MCLLSGLLGFFSSRWMVMFVFVVLWMLVVVNGVGRSFGLRRWGLVMRIVCVMIF